MKKVLLSLFIVVMTLCIFVSCEDKIDEKVDSVSFKYVKVHQNPDDNSYDEEHTITITSNGTGNYFIKSYKSLNHAIPGDSQEYEITEVDYGNGEYHYIYNSSDTKGSFFGTSLGDISSYEELKSLDKVFFADNWQFEKVTP